MPRRQTDYAERARLRAGIDYVLRLMRVYTDLVGGDPMTALVFIAAAQAVSQHVKTPAETDLNHAFLRDDLRRPVSVSALARSLGMPVETTRRHVIRLAGMDLVERTANGGVIVTSRQLGRPDVRAAVLNNTINLEQLLATLGRIEPLPSTEPGQPRPT